MTRSTKKDMPKEHNQRLALAELALEGLSVGDAFGECFFTSPSLVETLIERRAMPKAPWRWTDDTAMALAIVEVLRRHRCIDRDALADALVLGYQAEPTVVTAAEPIEFCRPL